jgi:exodeoxyribonuclease VII large subunit
MALSNREVLSVSDLNRQARDLLENEFPRIFVEGEISNIARPSSGHWYFTLKDSKAQIRCAMFRHRNRSVNFTPEDGNQIVVRGKISIYEGRGDFQLIADEMEEAGDGILQRAFEQLKQKLFDEGLFDDGVKKPLPSLPGHVGVITSPTGAAIRDVLAVMGRRFPAIKVSILPVQVQGDAAPEQIVKAITDVCRHSVNTPDVLLITRGGGSLEDLWAFNTEQVARAVHDCHIPVVSAIGHEIDFTITDFVADVRAPTPSAAAELICPDRDEWLAGFAALQAQLYRSINVRLVQANQLLSGLFRRLRHPGQRLQDQAQRLDDLEIRLTQATTHGLRQAHANLAVLASRLENPSDRIARNSLVINNLLYRLRVQIQQKVGDQSHQLTLAVQGLNALNPLSILDRGYAIVSSMDKPPHILKSVSKLKPGDRVSTRLHEGQFVSVVEKTQDNGTE